MEVEGQLPLLEEFRVQAEETRRKEFLQQLLALIAEVDQGPFEVRAPSVRNDQCLTP